MRIKRIEIENYKSYEKTSINMDNFSVLVGANASGKSNLIGAIRLLRDANRYGLKDALSLQGGVNFMKNVKHSDRPVVIKYFFDESDFYIYKNRPLSVSRANARVNYILTPVSFVYTLEVDQEDKQPIIIQDVSISYEISERSGQAHREIPGVGRIRIRSNKDMDISSKHTLPSEFRNAGLTPGRVDEYFSPYLRLDSSVRKSVFLKTDELPIIDQSSYVLLEGVQLDSLVFFDFDPKLAKQSSKFAGKRELEEDGSNFNVAMNYVLEKPENKRKFIRTLSDFLPFITNFKVNQSVDQSLMSLFSEHNHKEEFPSYAMSDGTMYLACLVLGITFSSNELIVIEEPEKYIHPALSLKVIDFLKDASESKQILVTSHSPQLVKQAGVDNLIVVSRKGSGSELLKASDIPHVKHFLEGDLGLDQLFADNLLTN